MKTLINLTAVLLLSVLLVLPVSAQTTEGKNPSQSPAPQPAEQAAEPAQENDLVNEEVADDPHQSDAFKRQQEYFQKREAMKKHRDEALKIREQNTN